MKVIQSTWTLIRSVRQLNSLSEYDFSQFFDNYFMTYVVKQVPLIQGAAGDQRGGFGAELVVSKLKPRPYLINVDKWFFKNINKICHN